MDIKETPRNLAQTARRSAKYRNPDGPSRYFAPMRRRKLVDEHTDEMDVKALEFQESLCPLLWRGAALDEKVRTALLKVTDRFIEFLGVKVKVKDIILTGSMAGYNWNDNSDIDVHVLVDHNDIDADEEIVSELFASKKIIWNTQYNVKMKGHDVEMYVQDVKEKLFARGVYSLSRNGWVKKPTKEHPHVDVTSAKIKAADIMGMIDNLNDIKDGDRKINRVEKIKERIKRMRSNGLATSAGEFSPENIAFKILRNSGYIKKLLDTKAKAYNTYFSLNESASPKYEFGCLMAYFRPKFWDKLLAVIDPSDVYEGDGGYGLEHEPHVTILFGFHQDKADVRSIKRDADALLNGQALEFSCMKASLFDNPEYDVLKFDVEDTTGMLSNMNAHFSANYENSNKYPDYHPHVTIAYIKKGEGQKYADIINESGLGFKAVPDRLVYSQPPNQKFFWRLKANDSLEVDNDVDLTPEKLEVIKDFILFTKQKLGIKGRVFVSLRGGRDEYIRTTAAYGPDEDKNYIRCNGRALVDILRSIGHEMVHNKQREVGIIKPGVEVQNIGGKIEGAANEIAGILIKDFTHNHGYDYVYDM
jgi:predicted nucleotidyltransferase